MKTRKHSDTFVTEHAYNDAFVGSAMKMVELKEEVTQEVVRIKLCKVLDGGGGIDCGQNEKTSSRK